jgi:hypothetical protein
MALMTENYPPVPPPQPPVEPLAPLPPQPQPWLPEEDQPGTADVVKDQAADLKQAGVEAGQHAVGVAQDQASQVVAEATRQGRDLLAQAQQEVGDQVAQGQQRLAAGLLSLGDELSSMADGSEQPGPAASLARQAASRAHGAGQWLDARSPAQVVDDVQAFARRKPGVFLALAVGAGLAAGRLTRGLKSAQSDDGNGAASTPRPDGAPGTADAWAASTGTALAEPAPGAGYPAPVPEAEDVVPGDDGSAVPVADGLPAAGAGSSWDAYPRADELGTLSHREASGEGSQ